LNGAGREFNSIILAKNTTAPCDATETYHTVSNNQTKINLRVTQGEDEDPAFVKILGGTVLSISPYPEGAPIDVTFRFDANQIVHVSAYDVTGTKDLGEFEIKGAGRMTEEQVDQLSSKMTRVAVS
jgi:molecular chaperone DnaK